MARDRLMLLLVPLWLTLVSACQDKLLEPKPDSGDRVALLIDGDDGPETVDTDQELPIDFEPIPDQEIIRQFKFEIDRDRTNLEALMFEVAPEGGLPNLAPGPVAHRLNVPQFGKFSLPTTAVTSQPNTGASVPVRISFGEDVLAVSFVLLDVQFGTIEELASAVDLPPPPETSTGTILREADLQEVGRATRIYALNQGGTFEPVNFKIEDLDPELPNPAAPGVTSETPDLSATGGPVNTLYVPGDGNEGGFSPDIPLHALRITITAQDRRIRSVTVVPAAEDFILIDELDFPLAFNPDCLSIGFPSYESFDFAQVQALVADIDRDGKDNLLRSDDSSEEKWESRVGFIEASLKAIRTSEDPEVQRFALDQAIRNWRAARDNLVELGDREFEIRELLVTMEQERDAQWLAQLFAAFDETETVASEAEKIQIDVIKTILSTPVPFPPYDPEKLLEEKHNAQRSAEIIVDQLLDWLLEKAKSIFDQSINLVKAMILLNRSFELETDIKILNCRFIVYLESRSAIIELLATYRPIIQEREGELSRFQRQIDAAQKRVDAAQRRG